jgi:hypothetical protein
MKERNIKVTLEKAKEWYNSSSADLKAVALQAYSEEELKTKSWENIKTFEDACNALGISNLFGVYSVSSKYNFSKHLTALYKLDIIRRALNKDYNPSLVHGSVYYPLIKLYNRYDDAKNVAKNNNWNLCGKIEFKGTSYFLVGGDCYGFGYGLSSFSCGCGIVDANLGFLCCKSGEIAQHMSKYFAKEIFDAVYKSTCKYNIER